MLLILLSIALADMRQVANVANINNIDPTLFRALVLVESGGRQSAINHKTHDYGIAQINKKTAAAYKLDAELLKTDVTYNLNAAAKILLDFKKQYGAKEPLTWPCRYNIGNQKLPATCLKYLNKLKSKGWTSK